MNYVGIDIGGTNIKCAVVNAAGEIIKKSNIKTHATRTPEAVITDIADEIKRITGDSGYEAVGVGCPGAINSHDGIVEYSPNLFWRKVPLAGILSKLLGKKVRISNDANVAALGEHKFGAGRNFTDTALITLGTGVGGGFVVGGKLFEGFRSMGTEIGHTVIKENGIQCTCGRKGCFETYASASALVRQTIHAMLEDKNSSMWKECENDLNKVDGKTAFCCAKTGDKTAKRVVADYIKSLSEGVINVVNLFRSEAVILGGGICAEKEYLTKPVQEFVDKYRYGGEGSLQTVILTAELGNNAGVIGAAGLAM
jgi:glucokinase